MALTIRDATRADAAWLARVIYQASRSHRQCGFWDLLFPGSLDRRLGLIESIGTNPVECNCHHGGFLVAELDGERAGALSGYDPRVKDQARFSQAIADAVVAVGMADEELVRLEGRVQPYLLCQPEFDAESWVVEWVAVEPQCRSRGVVDAMLEAIFQRGRDRGHRRAELALMMGNDRAQAAYLRSGFDVVATRTHPSMQSAVGCAGVARMAMEL